MLWFNNIACTFDGSHVIIEITSTSQSFQLLFGLNYSMEDLRKMDWRSVNALMMHRQLAGISQICVRESRKRFSPHSSESGCGKKRGERMNGTGRKGEKSEKSGKKEK